jgi:hypothetical protein
MKPVLPARTSMSGRPSRWFVLWKTIGRPLSVDRLYSDSRITDEMRSSCDASVMRRAMSYADDILSDSSPDGSA